MAPACTAGAGQGDPPRNGSGESTVGIPYLPGWYGGSTRLPSFLPNSETGGGMGSGSTKPTVKREEGRRREHQPTVKREEGREAEASTNSETGIVREAEASTNSETGGGGLRYSPTVKRVSGRHTPCTHTQGGIHPVHTQGGIYTP